MTYYWLEQRARYYAPGTGVFTALDPFEGSASRPMSLNGYLYVEGDPVNLRDPSGLTPTVEGILGTSTEEPQYEYSCLCGWIDWSHAKITLPTYNY